MNDRAYRNGDDFGVIPTRVRSSTIELEKGVAPALREQPGTWPTTCNGGVDVVDGTTRTVACGRPA